MANPGQGLGRGKGRTPIYDPKEIARLYMEEGKTIYEIAPIMGCAPSTVRDRLIKLGIWYPQAKAGRPRQEVCGRGHDQKIWRRETRKGGGFCGKCKYLRDKGKL